MENEELLIRKNIILNRRKIWADVAVGVLLCLLFWYLFLNIDEVKLANSDSCELCEIKTNGLCSCSCAGPNRLASEEPLDMNGSKFDLDSLGIGD